MLKNIRLSAKTLSAIKSSLLRKVCKGAIALAIMTYSCPGQVINSQDDSLLIDEFRTVKPVAADTVYRQSEIARPLGADSISKQRETSRPNAADTISQQQEIGKPVSADSRAQQQEIGKTIKVDTVPQPEEIGKPVTTEPVRSSHAEETPWNRSHAISPLFHRTECIAWGFRSIIFHTRKFRVLVISLVMNCRTVSLGPERALNTA